MAARFGDETISVEELDAWIRDDLFDGAWDTESELFELRTKALERMATETILGRTAAARNLSIEDYLLAEVAAQGEISDEEVAAFYDERKGDMQEPFEALVPRIRTYLKMKRGADYVKKLRAETNFNILLERPRIEMAAVGPSRGPDDAAVTIIEFSDFQCPYCSRALPEINLILERYPNDVRIIYRHLPLDRIHPRARAAAEASLCADDQGKFWPFHDLLFANAKTLADEDLSRFAKDVELDVAAFEQCITEGRFKQKIQEDVDAATGAGITSTPAFLVNGIFVGGAKPVDHFAEIIDAELASGAAGDDES
ncbi:MAG: DsbA family protein [Deltaproteobacteria bacterium]|nr:DsbA family protein [Deltaproteobacteria bacterium]MBW2398094.1 DsbA family protein [Deltaproteobacteria bacterium]MBW2666757.1 DsbA family protein [Deltaproteobacteria bacterium]